MSETVPSELSLNKNEHLKEVVYPILSYAEAPKGIDLRHQLSPDDLAAVPDGCRVVSVRKISMERPADDKKVSTIRAALTLTNASTLEDINNSRIPNAAVSLGFDIKDPALRRFEAPHGRDALDVAMRMGKYYPGILRNTLVDLAKMQGTINEVYDSSKPFRQEEPGRIILVNRKDDDPIRQRFSNEMGWGFPFYGSVDATATYILGIDQSAKDDPSIWDEAFEGRSGPSNMRGSFNLAGEWLMHKITESSSGFVEFHNKDPRPGHGMDCQAWRDSSYAYTHKDGSRANVKGGVASFDVQVFTYQALVKLSENSESRSHKNKLLAEAEKFRKKIIKDFWVKPDSKLSDGGGYFALGVDHDPKTGKLRQLAVKASSMSTALVDGFLNDSKGDAAKKSATVKRLMSPEMTCYAGFRTIASDEVGYGPHNYHTGSSWLWDTANRADDLETAGFAYLAWEARAKILRIVNESNIFPEFVSGHANRLEIPNTEVYTVNDEEQIIFLSSQAPQTGQGWTIAATFDIKRKVKEFLANPPTPKPEEADAYRALMSVAA